MEVESIKLDVGAGELGENMELSLRPLPPPLLHPLSSSHPQLTEQTVTVTDSGSSKQTVTVTVTLLLTDCQAKLS